MSISEVSDAVPSDATITSKEHTPIAHGSQATKLVELCKGLEFFHSDDGEAYVTLKRSDHRETWSLRSKDFRDYLALKFYRRHRRTPGGLTIDEALRTLSGKARFDGAQRPIALRVAGRNDTIYLDLCNARWQAVEITATGWRVVDPPVRFVRRRGMVTLPQPTRDGSIDPLWSLLNITDPQARALISGWLIAALRPRGPYPVLVLQGEMGAAKSTVARMLRALVDPSIAPVRTVPRTESDLLIAARNSWVIALDNLSGLPLWLSDALCRLATGGGFSTRELYTNLDEVLIEVQRPCILNGIDDICTRDDLIDRAIIVNLEPIPETARRPETELWQAYDSIRPAILGALLDAVVTALRRLPDVCLDRLPRMADFAQWVTAAEPALGLNDGAFMAAYSASRRSAVEDALEGSAVANALRKMMDKQERWDGTATSLLAHLDSLFDPKLPRSKSWPKSARTLSSALSRLAPSLRSVGIAVTRHRSAATRRLTIERISKGSSFPSRASPVAPGAPNRRDAWMPIGERHDASRGLEPALELPRNSHGDAYDGNDAERT
ncbi:MAG: hypothetical protein OES46_16145 [Gammaproteobacteria bacterium]|nr:hypothetical protein [Gammaproteobacteria bacterium]